MSPSSVGPPRRGGKDGGRRVGNGKKKATPAGSAGALTDRSAVARGSGGVRRPRLTLNASRVDAGAVIRKHASSSANFALATRRAVRELGRGMTVNELETFRSLRQTAATPRLFRVADVHEAALATRDSNGGYSVAGLDFMLDNGEILPVRGVVAVLLALGWKRVRFGGTRKRLFPPATMRDELSAVRQRSRERSPHVGNPRWNLKLWEEVLGPWGVLRLSSRRLVSRCPLCGAPGMEVRRRADGVTASCPERSAGADGQEAKSWQEGIRAALFGAPPGPGR